LRHYEGHTAAKLPVTLQVAFEYKIMQTPLPLCSLCQVNPADKTNSHIIPKFFAKGLFDLSNPRHTVVVLKTGKVEKTQDTPKQDHLLCTRCEKRFEILETYFSRRIRELHGFNRHPDKFELCGSLLKWKTLSPVIFRLFMYSIIWRVSASSRHEFGTCKLPVAVTEDLRSFLNEHLKPSQPDLLNHIKTVDSHPAYHICLMKPQHKTTPPGGLFAAHSYNENLHLLMLVDFTFFFITDDNAIATEMKVFSNNYSKEVIIGLLRNDHWILFNQKLYNEVTAQYAPREK
jgi:hypothetical protein